MKQNFKNLLAVVALAGASSAFAVPTLTLSDGLGNTVTLAEGGAPVVVGGSTTIFSAVAGSGLITWQGNLGVWSVSVNTGLTEPASTAPYPHLHLNTVDSSTAAGTLTIRWTDDGQAPGSTAHAGLSYGGVLEPMPGASLVFNAYADAANGVPTATSSTAGLTSLGSLGPAAPTAFGGSLVGGSLAFASPYSLTEEVILTHTGAGVSSVDGDLQAVPEGGATLILLGSALGVMGLLRRNGVK